MYLADRLQVELHAAVVMPDHVHLIYSPLRREDGWSSSLPEIMKAIKGRSLSDSIRGQCPGPMEQVPTDDPW
jgi:REP element-mobilizing transposase RayT